MLENQSTHRQLAVVLFADIEGYTALMQTNENLAMDFLQRYQAAVREGLAQFNGELVKNLGDGCICVFSSTKAAVFCAKHIQHQLKPNPKVPLRIGVHLGDVIFKDNDVYGSVVNIASRIETLALAGSVLISADIYHKVKNLEGLQFSELGSFELKNVERPIELYALANEGLVVPGRRDLLIKQPAKRSKENSKFKALPIFMGLLMILAASGIYFFLPASEQKETKATEPTKAKKEITLNTLRDHNVAVMVFEDLSESDDLKSAGLMISDWITQGIFELNKGNVISAATIRSEMSTDKAPVLSSFAQEIGADVVVKGRYYLLDNQLVINGSIINPLTNAIIQPLPPVSGDRNQIMDLINQFSQNLLGYWSTSGNQYFDIQIPKYDAYKLSLEGDFIWMDDFRQSAKLFQQSYAADSTFATPLLRLIKLYANADLIDEAKELIFLIENRGFKLTELGQLELEAAKANINSNKMVEVTLNERIAEIDPSDAYMAGLNNLELNRLDKAIKYFKISIENNSVYESSFSQWNYGQLSHTYLRKGMYKECIELYNSMDFERQPTLIQGSYLISLAALNKWKEVDAFLEKRIATTRRNGFSSLLALLTYLYNSGNQQKLEKYINRMTITEEDQKDFTKAYFGPFRLGSYAYMRGDYKAAAKYYAQERYQGISFYQLACLIKAGKTTEAEALRQELLNTKMTRFKAYIPYALAQYHLAKGEKIEALNLLKEAQGQQMPFLFWSYDFDVLFRDLLNNETFQQLIVPK